MSLYNKFLVIQENWLGGSGRAGGGASTQAAQLFASAPTAVYNQRHRLGETPVDHPPSQADVESRKVTKLSPPLTQTPSVGPWGWDFFAKCHAPTSSVGLGCSPAPKP